MKFEVIIPYIQYILINKIVELRVKSKPRLSQLNLSQKLGVSDGYIGQLENPNDALKLSVRMLGKISEVLGFKSYGEIFPDNFLKYDIVRIGYEEVEKSNKKKDNEDLRIKRKFEEVSIIPLSDKEIECWKELKSPYMLNPKLIKKIFH